MKSTRSTWNFLAAAGIILAVSGTALSQADVQRQTVAITYPLDQTVTVRFRGTTRLPRLSGEAKVRRAGRRGTRVELSISNLPRATELGGPYTTFVLWAITPEGRVDNLGEIKRGGSFLVNSKLDVTTPLQTFALIVTAEPHFLMRGPSRMVVLENLPPRNPNGAEVETINVRYIGNTSDYFNDPKVPEIADRDYRQTPVSLLGARQAVNLARYAGADRDAPDELKAAEEQLAQAENAWRTKQLDADVDAEARRAISLGARAEEVAEAHRAARVRRDEIAQRDRALREAESSSANAAKEISDLRAALDRETRARELAEHDLENASQQIRDLRTESARLRDELQNVRAEGEEAKLKLARLEGEKTASEAKLAEEQRRAQQQSAWMALKGTLSRFGTVKESSRGLMLLLSDSIWTGARSSEFASSAATKVEPLAALLANNPETQIIIEAYSDNRGDETALRKLTQDRADALAARLSQAGVDGARLRATGLGAANPVAPNGTASGRLRNRRVEIILVAPGVTDSPTTTSSASATP